MMKSFSSDAWGIVSTDRSYEGGSPELGSGERGKKYIFWDKTEAIKWIENNHPEMLDEGRWQVVPVKIFYDLGDC